MFFCGLGFLGSDVVRKFFIRWRVIVLLYGQMQDNREGRGQKLLRKGGATECKNGFGPAQENGDLTAEGRAQPLFVDLLPFHCHYNLALQLICGNYLPLWYLAKNISYVKFTGQNRKFRFGLLAKFLIDCFVTLILPYLCQCQLQGS